MLGTKFMVANCVLDGYMQLVFPNATQQELQTLFKFNTGFELCCRVCKQDKKESIDKVQDSEIEKVGHDKHVLLVEVRMMIHLQKRAGLV